MPQKTAQIFPQLIAMTTANAVVNGAKANYYVAGTTTRVSLYADHLGAVPLANPVTADSFGRFPTVFLTPGTLYDLNVTTSAGVSLDGYPIEDLRAAPTSSQDTAVEGTFGEAVTAGQGVYLSDGSGSKTAGLWYLWDADNTYSSTLPEIGLALDATGLLAVGTIIKAGRATGLSSLTVGAKYYCSTTAGALTTTAPSNSRYVGQADSTTSLNISANPPTSATGLTTYICTTAQVLNTVTKTAIVSATIGAAVANGDKFSLFVSALVKNNKGSAGTVTFELLFGGVASVLTLVPTFADNATERSSNFEIVWARGGANAYILESNNPPTRLDTALVTTASSGLPITAPTFTAGQTFELRATLSAADASFYIKPQGASLAHFRN